MAAPPDSTAPNLERLRPSPVRGQLEPYSPKSPPGWRYLQTTDTPDEFKVLLPPGTASMYDYLLKLEAYELTRRTSINWERLMQIRHLKDRMVRKCQRLSKASPAMKKATKGEPFGFQTIVAPSDFRLKEMEKWFREQQKRATGTSKPVVSRPEKPTVASSTRPPQQQPSSTKPQTLIRAPANSEKLKEQAKPRGVQGPPQQEQRSISLPNSKRERAPPPRTYSPAPLPIILVAQREDYGLEPSFVEFASIEEVERSPIPPEISGINTSRQDGSTSPDSNPDVTKADRPSLARQPSRIKKTSISELAKNVSWVDGQELDKQIARYAAAAKQAQSAGTWNEVRKLYFEQLRGLHNLHEQVCEGLDQLRTETEHLQRVEESVRRQREMLKASFADFENKYSQFQGKVEQVISEATSGLVNDNDMPPRIELPSIHETS